MKYREAFDNCVKSKKVKSAMTGNNMIDGMLVYNAIATIYSLIKNDKQFQAINTITILRDGFDPSKILKEELQRALKKYCGMESKPYDNDFNSYDVSDDDVSLGLLDDTSKDVKTHNDDSSTHVSGLNLWTEKDCRNFTVEEIAEVETAVIVESNFGHSVCFNMKKGGQRFIPVELWSNVRTGDVVDLTKAKIKTLSKRGEADILRISI